ncbi:DUF3800 domain-containing protein [Candidatus Bipolaricaulota bacterium]|nr:DUF3800 domain-containing protein [Candidatus Bipolaricaulota bacterium]
MKYCFCGWSDESSHNVGRFRAVGMISHPYDMTNELEENINEIIANFCDGEELKWAKISEFKLKAYKNIIDYFLEDLDPKRVRVDVLRWDTENSRHNIQKRDDNKNLQMMYYKLFKNVAFRWPHGKWNFFLDENRIINRDELKRYLDKSRVNIKTIKKVNSKDNPLIQVADFFTGMSVFSKKNFKNLNQYEDPHQTRLVPLEDNDLSKKDNMRFEILIYFDKKCKDLKKGVSLKSGEGLWTPNPNNTNLNFWHYEPQVEEDKAPTK